jgi:hypothetical protein
MKREELIEEYLAQPIKEEDIVYIKGMGSQDKSSYHNATAVLRVEDEGQTIVYREHRSESKTDISNVKKYTGDIGANPIDETLWRKVQSVNFNLDSILFKLGVIEGSHKNSYKTDKGFPIKVLNVNPFVEIGGEKKYYQRPFVWTLDEMQALIHSIYNRIECGKIVIRERSWKWLHSREDENECYWYDVVDGKQRLTTLQKFLNNEFTDKFGNYFEDLSEHAQNKFTNHQLFSYNEMNESVTDEDVVKQFLSINFAGVPQSIEHINYVESLLIPVKKNKNSKNSW